MEGSFWWGRSGRTVCRLIVCGRWWLPACKRSAVELATSGATVVIRWRWRNAMPDIQLWQVNSVSPAVCQGYRTSCHSALRYHREILWLWIILIGRRLGFWIFRGHWNPARPLWFGRSWPDRNISLCLMCHRAKFSHSASNHKNVITEILQKIVTHHAAPFKVTQSPWNRHYLIDYLW